MALVCGADAVFELPVLFAVRTADAFARGGVGILDGLGADALSFGSEITDLALLNRIASLREREPRDISEAISRHL
jgi:predicted nucleotidyltransferase